MKASIDVLHVKETYLHRSEKWFHYILGLNSQNRKWLASRLFENLDEFPLGAVELIRVAPENLLTKVANRCSQFLIDRPMFWGSSAYAAAVQAIHPQLIHAHYGPMGYVLCRDRAIEPPIITSFYGYDISKLPQSRFWRESYAELFQRGAGFIVEGGQMRKALVNLGCDPQKAFIVRVPIDPEKLPFKKRNGVASGKKIVLMCCNFVEKKGIPWALHAFALTHARFPDTELRIIGSGELWSMVVDLVRDLKLTNAVTLLGAQPHSVFITEAMNADIFMQPSITASDGTTEGGAPTVLIEAQCMGLPVLSSFHADIPEIVRDGESGYLVAEKDVESLSAALCRLLEAPHLWPEMGNRGREHAIRQHAPCAVASQLTDVYGAVLQSRSSWVRQ